MVERLINGFRWRLLMVDENAIMDKAALAELDGRGYVFPTTNARSITNPAYLAGLNALSEGLVGCEVEYAAVGKLGAQLWIVNAYSQNGNLTVEQMIDRGLLRDSDILNLSSGTIVVDEKTSPYFGGFKGSALGLMVDAISGRSKTGHSGDEYFIDIKRNGKRVVEQVQLLATHLPVSDPLEDTQIFEVDVNMRFCDPGFDGKTVLPNETYFRMINTSEPITVNSSAHVGARIHVVRPEFIVASKLLSKREKDRGLAHRLTDALWDGRLGFERGLLRRTLELARPDTVDQAEEVTHGKTIYLGFTEEREGMGKPLYEMAKPRKS